MTDRKRACFDLVEIAAAVGRADLEGGLKHHANTVVAILEGPSWRGAGGVVPEVETVQLKLEGVPMKKRFTPAASSVAASSVTVG